MPPLRILAIPKLLPITNNSRMTGADVQNISGLKYNLGIQPSPSFLVTLYI